MRHIPRTPAVLAAVFAASVLLSGCSAGAGSAGDEYRAPESGENAAPGVVELQDGSVAADSAGTTSASVEAQALVVTGSIIITADDPIAAAQEATRITIAADGRVDARTEYAPRDDDAGRAVLTLRIPAAAIEDVREQLAELGTVDETDFDTVDVAGLRRDLATRISTLSASIARYTQWIGTADTTSDLIELESAISSRQTELESLEAQQRELEDSVAMSTVTLTLQSVASAPPPQPEGPTDFWSALAVGWNAFVAFWAAIAVGLGVALPWLVLLGALAVAVVWIIRRASRHTPTPPAPAVAGVSGTGGSAS